MPFEILDGNDNLASLYNNTHENGGINTDFPIDGNAESISPIDIQDGEWSFLSFPPENSLPIASESISRIRRKCKERYVSMKDYIFELENEVRDIENRLHEESVKRGKMKKSLEEAMEKMIQEKVERTKEELIREMMDHMTDQKMGGLLEAMKHLVEGAQMIDRTTEVTKTKKRIRLEMEEI